MSISDEELKAIQGHTPGPWTNEARRNGIAVVGSESVHVNGRLRNELGISSASYSDIVCEVYGSPSHPNDPLSPVVPEINARLIAAAPVLLSELIAARAEIDEAHKTIGHLEEEVSFLTSRVAQLEQEVGDGV